jgi:RNase P/RNase MRP subunit p30
MNHNNPHVPPPTIYSCSCHAGIKHASIEELEKKLQELETDLKAIINERQKKREILGD